MVPRDDRLPAGLLALVLVALVAAGITPYDRRVFWLEVGPWLVCLAGLVATHRRHRMTPLAYLVIAGLCLLFVVGAHYTYSRVPLGFRIRDALGLSRNPYDRIVHFAGGFAGGIVVREALLRRTRLVRGWRTAMVVSLVCLAGGAIYEIVEWWLAVATHHGANAFLAMQGDEWDSQWDMLLALIGAAVAQALLSRLHDRQMRRYGLGREA